jgi:signal transduction histidine kinase
VSRFWATAAAGGVVVTILLIAGMLFAVRGLDALATAQRERIRAGESQISLAENLRLSGEAMVSASRGYLLTGDRTLLEQLVRANANFDHSLAALRKYARGSHAVVAAQDLARVGDELVQVQKDLVAASGVEAPGLLLRFKAEFLPAHATLVYSLDELVQQTQRRMDALYAQTASERNHLMVRMYVLFGLLVLFAAAITWLFATHTARVYELERKAHEVARRAIATRDELMGVVAHDLRNPLTSIGLKAALVQRLAHAQDVHESAQSIASTVRQMEGLIGGLLDVSVIESGRFFVNPAPCSVDALLRECIDTFSPLFAARGVRLETQDNHQRLTVEADDERIQQLMSNLLGNALKYAPPGSAVRIAVEESDGVARFSVSDSGRGIAAAHLPHVFDRFWKHEQGGGNKGTGLGLFIAKGIVDAHGGDIGVESPPGGGATFYFTLRIVQRRTEGGRHDEIEAPSAYVGGLAEPATLQAP